MNLKVINESHHRLPEYKTKGSAGLDLIAYLDRSIKIKPLERVLIPTGLYLEIPYGFEVQIRPRSGLAYKSGITVANAPGTIDSDYRGELKVILVNLSNEEFEISDGDRIAQMILAKHDWVEWQPSETLQKTVRGSGGFGHTGK